MENYIIFADTGCDIQPSLLTEWGIPSLDLTFKFDGDRKSVV